MGCFAFNFPVVIRTLDAPGALSVPPAPPSPGSIVAPSQLSPSLYLYQVHIGCVGSPLLAVAVRLIGWNTIVMKEPGSNVMPEWRGNQRSKNRVLRVVNFDEHDKLRMGRWRIPGNRCVGRVCGVAVGC